MCTSCLTVEDIAKRHSRNYYNCGGVFHLTTWYLSDESLQERWCLVSELKVMTRYGRRGNISLAIEDEDTVF
jgi:hypothetical protein